MTIAISSLVDFYLGQCKKMLDPSDLQAQYASDKQSMIELTLSEFNYANEAALPVESNSSWKQLIALHTCKKFIFPIRMALMFRPLIAVTDKDQRAEYESREKTLAGLEKILDAEINRLKTEVGRAQDSLPIVFQEAPVQRNVTYDITGEKTVVDDIDTIEELTQLWG